MQFNSLLSEMFTKVQIQLYKEHDYICYLYRLKLKSPIIVLEDLSSEWGSWNPTFKVIRLSKNLIKDYPWDVVIQVLKHEIAHQIVTELYHADDQHGELFQQACELLAIKPRFRKAVLKLQDLTSAQEYSNFTTEDQVMLRKVEKLLSLAQSGNEHEAQLAMEKVQEIYQKFNISNLTQKNPKDFQSIIIYFKKKNIPSTYQGICALIQNHFFVNIIFGDTYDYLNNEIYKQIEIIGRTSNVKMAEYVFYFLKDQIEKLWFDYQRKNKVPVKFKLSYQKGIIEGFETKLSQQKQKLESENAVTIAKNGEINNLPALLNAEVRQLDSFTKSLYPRISCKSTTASTVYSEFYSEGKSAGKQIVLHKPLTEKKAQAALYLNDD